MAAGVQRVKREITVLYYLDEELQVEALGSFVLRYSFDVNTGELSFTFPMSTKVSHSRPDGKRVRICKIPSPFS